MRKNRRGSSADIVTRKSGRRAELLRLTQKAFFEPQRQKRARPSCCNCKPYVNIEGNIKTTSACASYPRARLCFLPLMWSSQATLSFRVQSQTWGDVKTRPRQRLGTCNNHHLAVKPALLVCRRCTGNDDTFSNPVLDINPVIALHKRRSLDVRLADVLT